MRAFRPFAAVAKVWVMLAQQTSSWAESGRSWPDMTRPPGTPDTMTGRQRARDHSLSRNSSGCQCSPHFPYDMSCYLISTIVSKHCSIHELRRFRQRDGPHLVCGADGIERHDVPRYGRVVSISNAVVGAPGALLGMVTLSSDFMIRPAQTFRLTSTVWLMAALAGAVPLMVWSSMPTNAIFEAMSGINTTGITVMPGSITHRRASSCGERCCRPWAGFGFIVTEIVILPVLKTSGI